MRRRSKLASSFLVGGATLIVLAACSSTPEETERPTGQARQQLTTTIPASGDTHVRSGTPNQNFGALTSLRLQASGSNRALVQFSSSAMQSFATGSTVTLRFTISDNGENWGATGRPIAIHRLTKPWGEANATWNCAMDANMSNSQPDCSGATEWEMGMPNNPLVHPWVEVPTAIATITSGQTGDVTFDVTADVTLFNSGAVSNYGWIVKKVSEGMAGRVEFASRETATPPVLIGTCADGDDSGTCDPADGGDASSGDGSSGSDGGGGSNDGGGGTGDAGGDDGGPTCTVGGCDDGNECTVDSCEVTGCVHTPRPDGTSCSDQNVCTLGDQCSSGVCVATGMVDPSDGNPCTSDSCDPVLGIIHASEPSGTPCPNGTVCDGAEACDGAGACHAGTPLTIDDANPCTDDSCDPITGVQHTPRPVGSACTDDNNACNGPETCNSAAACVSGPPPQIDDGLICTADSCSPITGPVHTPIPGCDPTPTGGDSPFETRASIMGRLTAGSTPVTGAAFTVTDAPIGFTANPPRTDVAVSVAGDGSFRLRLTSFPDVESDQTPPKHVLLKIEASAYLPVYRDAWLHTGDAFDLGVIRFVARDANVTNIGPAGGTASDSQNRIQVVVPPGALTTTIPIQISPILIRDEMPAPLPDSTPSLYGFNLSPDGTTFLQPVSIRVTNFRNAPTNVPIPTGVYDVATGRWEHETQAIWNGSQFVFEMTHFSEIDCNYPRSPSGPGAGFGFGPPPDKGKRKCTGSSARITGGGLCNEVELPTYRVRNEDFGLALAYDSGHAGSRLLGEVPSNYQVVEHSTFGAPLRSTRVEASCLPSPSGSSPTVVPGQCVSAGPCGLGQASAVPFTASLAVAGATVSRSLNVSQANGAVEIDSFVHVPALSTSSQTTSRGLYPARVTVTAQTPGACIVPSATFGVSQGGSPGVQTTLEDGPLATVDLHAFVNHGLTSPFGAGWGIRELSRVFRKGDIAYLASGDGTVEYFHPRAHVKSLIRRSVAFAGSPARDPRTGEVFATFDNAVQRMDVLTGVATPVITGVPRGRGLAVAYVGSSRHFVVALADRLIDVDGAGAQRVLATRNDVPGAQQPFVAARDDVVLYTDGINPVLHRVRVSDAAPALETLSLQSGGDVRMFPRAPLSGVRFAGPAGLGFASDGTLFMADRRRNLVYAIAPETNGQIGPASRAEPVIGEGGSGFILPAGERYPGVRFGVREPVGIAVTDGGVVHVMTPYGLAAYDKSSREVEWLALWAGIGELTADPAFGDVGFVALADSSIFTSSVASQLQSYGRIDVDRLSSEFEPTRTIARIGSELELTDTTNALVERFDSAGRLVSRRHRTGEPIISVSYVDTNSDQVDRIIDAVGGETLFAYDASRKLQRITDARGRVTNVTVNNLGDLVSIQDPGNETYSFNYSAHRMIEKRSPRNDLTSYTFNPNGTLATATRPEGVVTMIDAALSRPSTFNAQGQLERTAGYIDGHGVSHVVLVNREGMIERDTYVADGVTRNEEVVYAGFLTDVDLNNVPDEFSRRQNIALLRVAARRINGIQTANLIDFDAHGRPVREIGLLLPGSSGPKHTWLYDDRGWLFAERDVTLVAQQYERDPVGHLLRVFDANGFQGSPTGRETRWTYRPDGLVATMTEHGVTRSLSYDDLVGTKNERGWTDTLGRSMTYTLDTRGNITSTNDGVATTFAGFDAKNRLTETRDALDNTTTYGHAHAGCNCSQENLVTSIHTPDLPAGVDWQLSYDRDSRLASITDPHGFTESYEYESTGELKRVIDKLLRSTSRTHDQLGRLSAEIDTLGRTHGHAYTVPTAGPPSRWLGPTLMAGSGDATSPPTTLTAPLRSGEYQIGKNAYLANGYPAQISLYRDATFELGYTETFDIARRTTTRQDRVGLPIDSSQAPAATSFGHDERFVWSNATGMSVLTSQDSIFIPSSSVGIRRSETFNRDFWFDVGSQLASDTASTSQSDPSQQDFFTRDVGGRVTQVRRVYFDQKIPLGPGVEQTSSYVYRPDGRLAQLTNADGVHNFTYNSRGLVDTQTVSGEGTYTFGYDVMGRNDFLEFPDAHVRRQQFDDLGRVTSRCYEYAGPTMRCYTAQYDAVGNPVRMTDPDGVDVLEYDSLDRLRKVTREVGGSTVAVEDYEYNALGALKTNASVALGHQRSRLDGAGVADAAVPASLGGQPVTLNAVGRVTSLRGSTFGWSGKGFLRFVQQPGPVVSEDYGVDAEQRRFARFRGATFATTERELYVYEGLDRIATIRHFGNDVSGTVSESYLFDGIDHPLRIKQGSTRAYYELDLAANVRGLRASGGGDLGRYRFTAFGKTAEDTTTFTQPLRWKGRWHSVVNGTEIYDVRARQWSPELGTFLTIDVYEYLGYGGTLWSWPGQNPSRWADPTGHYPTAAEVAAALAAGAQGVAAVGAGAAAAATAAGVAGIGGLALYCLGNPKCAGVQPGDSAGGMGGAGAPTSSGEKPGDSGGGLPPVSPPGGSGQAANDTSPVDAAGATSRGPPGPKSRGVCTKTHEAITGCRKTCFYYCPQDGSRPRLSGLDPNYECPSTIGFGVGR